LAFWELKAVSNTSSNAARWSLAMFVSVIKMYVEDGRVVRTVRAIYGIKWKPQWIESLPRMDTLKTSVVVVSAIVDDQARLRWSSLAMR
jgi:hypothetical protein